MFGRLKFKGSTKQPYDPDDTDPSLLKRKVELKKEKNLEQDYDVYELLGSGKFGEVKRCVEKETGKQFAAKFVSYSSPEEKDSVNMEIKVMKRLRHARLLQLYDAYSYKHEMVLILELIRGGELFERVIDESFDLTEEKCEKFMKEILEGVEYIHSQKVIHLDLKPENILCLTPTGFRIKIIDFGLARFNDKKDIRVMFGTPEFVAPEIISYEAVSPATDMWAVGVICYVLLSGLSPFMGENDGETFANILKVKYSFDYDEFENISAEAKDFISKLLVKEQKQRLKAREALNHPWIKHIDKLHHEGSVNKKRLKRYVYKRKWQKAIFAIIALTRMGVNLSGQHPGYSENYNFNGKSEETAENGTTNSAKPKQQDSLQPSTSKSGSTSTTDNNRNSLSPNSNLIKSTSKEKLKDNNSPPTSSTPGATTTKQPAKSFVKSASPQKSDCNHVAHKAVSNDVKQIVMPPSMVDSKSPAAAAAAAPSTSTSSADKSKVKLNSLERPLGESGSERKHSIVSTSSKVNSRIITATQERMFSGPYIPPEDKQKPPPQIKILNVNTSNDKGSKIKDISSKFTANETSSSNIELSSGGGNKVKTLSSKMAETFRFTRSSANASMRFRRTEERSEKNVYMNFVQANAKKKLQQQ